MVDLDDDSKTENTRAAYKLERIANALPTKRAGHPSSVVFLAADAFAVLPPIARLSRDQAMYWFLSGFTAKLAGTELGVTEPQPTFSTCFGAPFLPQPPGVYARMLGEKLDRHGASVWLVNTGWTGGPFGVGHRMPITATRGLLHAALSGALDDVRVPNRPGLRLRGARRRPGRRQRGSSTRARPGPTRRPTTRRRRSSPRCSATNFEAKFAADVDPAVAAAGRSPASCRLDAREVACRTTTTAQRPPVRDGSATTTSKAAPASSRYVSSAPAAIPSWPHAERVTWRKTARSSKRDRSGTARRSTLAEPAPDD